MKTLKSLLFLLSILLIFGNSVLAQDSDDTIAQNVEAFAENEDNPEFTVLLELLNEADLVDVLDDVDAEFTVFAPTDDAFEDLLEELDAELEDLLEDEDLVTQVLLYHVVAERLEAGDLEDGQEIETVQGGVLTISIDDDEVTINDVAEVETADVENSNGIVHVIDAVLLPETSAASSEPCLVSTDAFNGASVHVGPGNNRTAVTFLEVDVEYEALGQNEDSEGTVWYLLDKEEAAPGRAINEAWVSSDEVNSSGDCDNVGESSAPPVIPIVNAPPPTTDDGSDESASTGNDASLPVGSLPAAGTWTIFYAEFTNFSCQGTGNIPVPRAEVYLNLPNPEVTSVAILSGSSFRFADTVFQSIGNGVFQGVYTIEDQIVTYYIDNVTSNSMSGRFISSVVFDGESCSATTNWSASR